MHENIMPEAAGRQKVADGSGDADPQPLRRGIKPQPMPMRLAGGEGEAAVAPEAMGMHSTQTIAEDSDLGRGNCEVARAARVA
jgi:hypothetical protein